MISPLGPNRNAPVGSSGPESDRRVAARSSRHRPVERGGTAGKRNGGVARRSTPPPGNPEGAQGFVVSGWSEDHSPHRMGMAGVRSGTDEPVPVETGVAPLAP